MIWLLGGYLWMYVHRPFEIWDILGTIQLERGYMILLLVFWLAWPGKAFVANRMHLALGFMMAAIWISWMLSPYPAAGAIVVDNYTKVMVFYALLISSVRNDVDLRKLTWILVFSYGVYQLHSFREYVGGRYGYAQGVPRMMGVDITFADPNQFATAILASTPMVYCLFLSTKGVLRWMLLGQMCLTGVCIFLTCSRAGIVGMGFFLFLCVVFSRRRVLGLGLLCLLGLIVMAALPGYVYNRIMTLVDADAGPNIAHASAAGRLAGLYKGIDLLMASPLSGVGPGGFGPASSAGFQAHNLYGQVAGELGTLGVLALAFLLYSFFSNWIIAARLVRDRPELRETTAYRVVLAVGMGVLLLLLNGMAGHTLYRYNWVWLAAFQVVALNVLRRAATESVLLPEPVWVYDYDEPRPALAA